MIRSGFAKLLASAKGVSAGTLETHCSVSLLADWKFLLPFCVTEIIQGILRRHCLQQSKLLQVPYPLFNAHEAHVALKVLRHRTPAFAYALAFLRCREAALRFHIFTE